MEPERERSADVDSTALRDYGASERKFRIRQQLIVIPENFFRQQAKKKFVWNPGVIALSAILSIRKLKNIYLFYYSIFLNLILKVSAPGFQINFSSAYWRMRNFPEWQIQTHKS